MQQVDRPQFQLSAAQVISGPVNSGVLVASAAPAVPLAETGGGFSLVLSSTNPLVQTGRQMTRFWVLNRTLVVRVLAAVIVALVLTLAFQSRGGIYQAATTTGQLLSGQFAAAGLGISEISITGQSLTTESSIAQALAIADDSTIFGFDPVAARNRLLALPAVRDASVRKIYPARLVVEIVEVAPVARWRIDGVTYVIDETGTRVGEAITSDLALPLIIGSGAADVALIMIRALDRHQALMPGLAALSRIADRRWDLIYDSGLRVQLPERGLARALADLEEQHATHQLLDRDLDLIDLRTPGMMALRVTNREETD